MLQHQNREGLVLTGSEPVRQARLHECTPAACGGAMEGNRRLVGTRLGLCGLARCGPRDSSR